MGRDQPSNVAASVRQRLLNRARAQGEDYQALLTRYVLERFLYRLSRSSHRDHFVVKGAMLFLLWEGEFHRTMRDLDLLAFGSSEIAHLEAAVREICIVAVEEDDGLAFHPETIRGQATREDQIYDGVRVTVEAHLGSARIPLQIDVGSATRSFQRRRKKLSPCCWIFPRRRCRSIRRRPWWQRSSRRWSNLASPTAG